MARCGRNRKVCLQVRCAKGGPERCPLASRVRAVRTHCYSGHDLRARLGIAAVISPKARPADGAACTNHGAGEIAEHRRAAPRRSAGSTRGTFGTACHRRGAYRDMIFRKSSTRSAEQPHQPVAGFRGRDRRTRLVGSATPVHLARSDACDPDFDTRFRAPDGAIAIVDGDGGAAECLALRNDWSRGCRGRRRGER